ncbi:isochorismatase family protein [Bremerella sp.]|uniref:isochorismatase family protein n=1 Tax=Bremerella sp. TaxID=2795602 RepID=UPI00391CBC75
MSEPLPNPLLMNPSNTVLLVIDMQEKLLPSIPENDRIVWNARRLLDGAEILGVAALGTEQYRKGLGATVEPLAAKLGEMPDKLHFSSCQSIATKLEELNRPKILMAGIEAHVCVQQTALDLLSLGYDVYLATDAVGSRFSHDYEIALRRMESTGVTLTTTEAALFEWCREAGTPQFKQISQLVREAKP